MKSAVKETLSAILGNVSKVRAYHLPDDFNALWTMQPQKSPLIIVWNETPPDWNLAPIDCRSVLSPIDWAVAYIASLNSEDKWPNILILDLQPESHRTTPLYLRFNEMRPGLLPWLQILPSPDISLSEILDFIHKATPHKSESHHREAHRALMHQAWFTLTAGASEQETEIDRHAIANIIGPLVLTDLADPALADSTSLHQAALVQALRAHKLIRDRDGHNVQPETVVGSMAGVTLHLVDDQARQGWYAWVKTTSSQLLPSSTVQLWEDRNKFLDAIETVVSSLAESPNADLRFRLNFSDSGNDILLLDLRLFSGRSENDEAEFFLRVIDLCKSLNGRAKKGEALSPPFDQGELKGAEEWCYEASDKNRTRKDRRYVNALTLLPRLIAHLDMSLPIVIFSSSTLASTSKAFQSYGNILTSFAKPTHFNAPIADLRKIASSQFREAISQAASFLRVRKWLREVNANQSDVGELTYGIPEGAVIEVYIDESGQSFDTKFAVGGHVIVYPSADAIQTLASQLAAKKLIWGIDDANNGITRGNLFKIPERDLRATGQDYDEVLGQLQALFDNLNIRIGAIGLRRGYARRALMPSGITGLDPALSDSAFSEMLADAIECALFGLFRSSHPKNVVVNIYAATKLGAIPESHKSAAEQKHGFKFAYVSARQTAAIGLKRYARVGNHLNLKRQNPLRLASRECYDRKYRTGLIAWTGNHFCKSAKGLATKMERRKVGPPRHEGADLIRRFYCGGTDHRGRTLSQILQKSDRWLEETHDYIQWLFPLYVRSRFNPHAPLLTDEVRLAFTNLAALDYPILQQHFSQAIYRMLVFYGYSVSPLAPDVVSPTGEWADKAENWLTDGNHNFMRITRMLRSVTLLGRQELARSFYSVLTAAARAHPKIISKRTLSFWDAAITIAPASPADPEQEKSPAPADIQRFS